jgi:hypothetical protein
MIRLGQPAKYQIKIQGRLSQGWSDWFDGMILTVERNGKGSSITNLTGTVADQPALHGLLARIRDLGLPLLLVKHLEEGGTTVVHDQIKPDK